MDTSSKNLSVNRLIQDICGHAMGSLERRRGLNELVRTVQQADRLWKAGPAIASGEIPVEDYYDALQQTWLYVCRNLCEAKTGKAYDPTIASLFTWINAYLKFRIEDMRRTRRQEEQTRASPILREGEWHDPLEIMPAQPSPLPIEAHVQRWVNQQEQQLRSIHVRDRPDINCFTLILRRLPPETAWSELSQELQVSVATLSGFYQRECLPRLRDFGLSEGFL
ncbi:sigma-70 family RNA polymerase sigma factor [Vacuolonema iberomarrocanum]|uniref:sigma-70 family RNA polymerase sigma factor n=1 Tax=Vacuolonema iberomarrocanum TaxID=3454632 RepID=UPI0019FC0CB8|nr:sigma-70 family RNA polymerase sigma factor [filamentous cyanobacterium LEGE 07170]